MFKFLFATMMILIIGDSASATDVKPWKLVSQNFEEARSKEEFVQLQKKYPHFFAEQDPEKFLSAYVETTEFQFQGQSMCKFGDHRLHYIRYAYGLCELAVEASDPSSAVICYQKVEADPEDKDPCAS